MPAGEASDQRSVLGFQGCEGGIEPPFHLLDRRMVGGQDTGPGEEFVVASPFASPAILVGVGVGVVLIGVIAAGVVYLRRREV